MVFSNEFQHHVRQAAFAWLNGKPEVVLAAFGIVSDVLGDAATKEIAKLLLEKGFKKATYELDEEIAKLLLEVVDFFSEYETLLQLDENVLHTARALAKRCQDAHEKLNDIPF